MSFQHKAICKLQSSRFMKYLKNQKLKKCCKLPLLKKHYVQVLVIAKPSSKIEYKNAFVKDEERFKTEVTEVFYHSNFLAPMTIKTFPYDIKSYINIMIGFVIDTSIT